MRNRIILLFTCLLAGLLSASCGKIEGESSIDNVEEISDLLVLKVRFADILTGSDDDVKLTYIARLDAYYAIDYSKVSFVTNIVPGTSKPLVTAKMPPLHLLREPVLVREGSDGGSETIEVEAVRKSAARVKTAVQKAAVLWAQSEARKEGWMALAKSSAEDCVKGLWLASKPNPDQYEIKFDWLNSELNDPAPSKSSE